MIHYRNTVPGSGVDGRALVATAQKLLAAAGVRGSSLSLTLVADDAMRGLNREYRGKDRPTDVLSFALAADAPNGFHPGERLLGDIVISVDRAREQAAGYAAPQQREIYRLLIHGLLHVLGHDHEAPAQRRAMEREERRLADVIGLPWPYSRGRRSHADAPSG
jgi:probable rRNA maturation factor